MKSWIYMIWSWKSHGILLYLRCRNPALGIHCIHSTFIGWTLCTCCHSFMDACHNLSTSKMWISCTWDRWLKVPSKGWYSLMIQLPFLNVLWVEWKSGIWPMGQTSQISTFKKFSDEDYPAMLTSPGITHGPLVWMAKIQTTSLHITMLICLMLLLIGQ